MTRPTSQIEKRWMTTTSKLPGSSCKFVENGWFHQSFLKCDHLHMCRSIFLKATVYSCYFLRKWPFGSVSIPENDYLDRSLYISSLKKLLLILVRFVKKDCFEKNGNCYCFLWEKWESSKIVVEITTKIVKLIIFYIYCYFCSNIIIFELSYSCYKK